MSTTITTMYSDGRRARCLRGVRERQRLYRTRRPDTVDPNRRPDAPVHPVRRR